MARIRTIVGAACAIPAITQAARIASRKRAAGANYSRKREGGVSYFALTCFLVVLVGFLD